MSAAADTNHRIARSAPPDGQRSTPAIEVRDLTKRFGDVLAVDGLSFVVPRGGIVGFLGPNGAGKTTTLRMLLGLVAPSSGVAKLNGRAYGELAEPLHEVGAMLEASSFHPGRSARSHLRVQAEAAAIDGSRVEEVLELVDLAAAADRRVGGFSLGMRQRLGLATALLPDPKILILDEPANGLDPEGVRWLRELLRQRAACERTILVSSHVLAEVAQIVQSVVILHHGRLVTHQPLAELTTGARRVVRVRSPRAHELRSAIAAMGGAARVVGPDRLEVTDASPEQVGTLAAAHRIPVFEIADEQSTLEEVFLRLTAASSSGEDRR